MHDERAAPEVEKLARQIYWSTNTHLMARDPLYQPQPWKQASPDRRRTCRTVAKHAIIFVAARP